MRHSPTCTRNFHQDRKTLSFISPLHYGREVSTVSHTRSVGSSLEKISKSMLEDNKHFSPTYIEWDEKQQERWYLYFLKLGNGPTILRSHSTAKLIRGGIPNTLRAKLWVLHSGAHNLMITTKTGYYQSLLHDFRGVESVAIEEIDKVSRTFT